MIQNVVIYALTTVMGNARNITTKITKRVVARAVIVIWNVVINALTVAMMSARYVTLKIIITIKRVGVRAAIMIQNVAMDALTVATEGARNCTMRMIWMGTMNMETMTRRMGIIWRTFLQRRCKKTS